MDIIPIYKTLIREADEETSIKALVTFIIMSLKTTVTIKAIASSFPIFVLSI